MHPNHEHGFAHATDPEAALARRLEVGRQSGVPEAALRALRRAGARDARRGSRG